MANKGYTYSFKEVLAALVGPGGVASLGDGSGAATDGISVAPVGDRNVMTMGADGSGMHSLLQDRSGHITVTLLKSSPINALLQGMFNFQTAGAANHGQNTLTIVHRISGDAITCEQVAFKKQPEVAFGAEGQNLVWEFDTIRMSVALGTGLL